MLDLCLFSLPKVSQLPQIAPLLRREAALLWSYAGYPHPVQAIAPFQATLWSTEKKVSGLSCACWLGEWEQSKSPLWRTRSQKHPCHHWSATSCCSQILKSKAKRSPSIIQSNFLHITDCFLQSLMASKVCETKTSLRHPFIICILPPWYSSFLVNVSWKCTNKAASLSFLSG